MSSDCCLQSPRQSGWPLQSICYVPRTVLDLLHALSQLLKSHTYPENQLVYQRKTGLAKWREGQMTTRPVVLAWWIPYCTEPGEQPAASGLESSEWNIHSFNKFLLNTSMASYYLSYEDSLVNIGVLSSLWGFSSKYRDKYKNIISDNICHEDNSIDEKEWVG